MKKVVRLGSTEKMQYMYEVWIKIEDVWMSRTRKFFEERICM